MSIVNHFRKNVLNDLKNNWSSDNEELNMQALEIARQETHAEWNTNLADFGDGIKGVHACSEFYRDLVRNGVSDARDYL